MCQSHSGFSKPLCIFWTYFLFLANSLAVASPLSWQKECTEDPENWCQDVQTALRCGAVEHCQQIVWNKLPVKTIPCHMCKIMVSMVGKILQDNRTDVSSLKNSATFLALGTRCLYNYSERSALEPLPVNAGEFCNVCQIVVTYIDNELQENETQAEIGTLLVKGCHLLPKPLTDQCDEIVLQYEPEALRLLVQIMDPSFVCTKIGACESSKEDLMGEDPCVWGPSYWCKNMETATQCNAVEHCRRHIWY
uniref:Prosaposin n=1 Tax=Chelonoidis abingdonii TaxID=106734 RepID=A0A8C0QP30_CHEAB